MRAAKTRTDIRREQIAAAALELMARHGPRSLNIARLARKVGVVPSGIYRHFRGKDAVLDAVLAQISRRLGANVDTVRAETPHALERLHHLLLRHVDLIQNNLAIPRLVFSEELFSGNAPRRRRVHQVIQGYLSRVAELVAEGQRVGGIRRDVIPRTASVLFLGILYPGVILRLASDGEFDLGRHARQAWPMFAQMLQVAPGRASRASRRNRPKAARASHL